MELPEPADVLDSPRLGALAKELKDGNREALKKFWDDMQDKAPLVEPVSGDARWSLVTFLWRGNDKTRRVGLMGGLPTTRGDKWLTHLAETDVWYRTEKIPCDARFTYHFQINRPVTRPRAGDVVALAKLMEHCPTRPDPLNPRSEIVQGMMPASLLNLVGAPAQPWVERLPGVPKGTLKEQKIKSEALKGERAVTIYTPANFDPNGEKCGLLVLFDGAWYQDSEMIPGPVILDNLIAKKKIQPMVAVFVKHDLPTRNKELSCSEPFADFVVKDLVPWVRAEYRVREEPQRTIVGGPQPGWIDGCVLRVASPGGLRQCGSCRNQDRTGGIRAAWSKMAEPCRSRNSGWLTQNFAVAPRRGPCISMSKSVASRTAASNSPLAETRRFRDVLKAKGYEVHYSEFNGGHEYVSWRGIVC